MGYQDYSAAGGVFFQGLEDDAFVEGIQIGGWFIQKQNGTVMEEGSCNANPLFLAAGKGITQFSDFYVITFG